MPLHIIRRDITTMRVDAIVNTTNEDMVGYSGVDYAVHTAAGPDLDEECYRLAPLGLGEVKVTAGYNLPVKYIFHTSGPVWQGGLMAESIILRSCYWKSLEKAVELGCNTIAFPLISSGAYGYPKDQVLRHAVQIISEFLYDHELMVYLCVFDRTSYEFSRALYAQLSALVEGREEEAYREMAMPRANAAMDCCRRATPAPKGMQYAEADTAPAPLSLREHLRQRDKAFAYKLFDWIDERGMTDVECYKKANVDKKTFSKIKCNPDTYRPSKQTAVAFAIALRLNLEETQDLLASAGLTLSRSFVFDEIIRYFIQEQVYDIFEINEALFEFDQVLLGV